MKIFYKNACITCRRAISELEKTETDLKRRDFFKEPFTEKELRDIVKKAGLTPTEMLRTKDRMYRELNLKAAKKTDAQLIRLMVRHPGLIKRPIMVSKGRVIVGAGAPGSSGA